MKHTILIKENITPSVSALLKLSVRVVGSIPSLKRMHYYIKFTVCTFKGHTSVVKFSLVPLLCVADRSWGFVDDRTVMVNPGSSEELYSENLKTIPQWVLLSGLEELM